MNPVDAFGQLEDALMRMVALNAIIQLGQEDACGDFDVQADRAMEAYEHLVIEEAALIAIKDALCAVYGGSH